MKIPESLNNPPLKEESLPENDNKLPPKELLLVFGQGPVINPLTGRKAEDDNILPGTEGLNFWSKDLAKAALTLYKLGSASNFVIVGGRTGGEQYKSEAALIAEDMQHELKRKDEDHDAQMPTVELEEKSRDSLENMVNFLNLHDKEGQIESGKIKLNVLCSPYHASRIKLLTRLFDLPIQYTFQADEILRYGARTVRNKENTGYELTPDTEHWDNETLKRLEDQLDLYRSSNFYPTRIGTEQKHFLDRGLSDNLWARELLERPEKWLSSIGKIQNNDKVMKLISRVKQLYPGMLEGKYKIDSSMDIDTVREKLRAITYGGLSQEEVAAWEANNRSDKGWPEEVKRRLDMLFDSENNK